MTERIAAARALIDQLIVNGVDRIFCVPGESYLSALDACYARDLPLTVFRNEGGAAMAADAYAKATGKAGVCFVTRGPGAANAFAGVHVAQHDSTPLILLVGQIERANRGRGAFQEVDYPAMFGGHAKWVAEVDDPARLTDYVSRAFQAALSGRPGPVVLALPKDVLDALVAPAARPAVTVLETAPSDADMSALAAMIGKAQRPFFIIGGTRWDEMARERMMDFAARFDMPVATSYRRLPLFDARHPCYAGDLGLGANPKLVARVQASDLVVLVGGRLGEIPSQGYTLFDIPCPRMPFVHVYPDPQEFGRVHQPTLAIHATPKRFIEALSRVPTPDPRPWRDETRPAHEEYLAFSSNFTPSADVDLAQVMMWLSDNLPENATICNGAGNYASWIHRYFRFRRYGQHVAPTSATMGYGVPAAVAIQQLYPRQLVVSIAGDGDFLMNGQEFATAVQYGLPIVVLVFDNVSYGTIRMHQERNFPARVIGTDLRNPDFAAYARAFGGYGARVERTADFPAAFEAARASGLPSILHVMMDPDRTTPTLSLKKLRSEGLARR